MSAENIRQVGTSGLSPARLDQIINLSHRLAKLAGLIDWRQMEVIFRAASVETPSRPSLPTRLMLGLTILKQMNNLSDEALCDRWLENPYYQYFCGEEFFRHELPFDRASILHWQERLEAEKLELPLGFDD